MADVATRSTVSDERLTWEEIKSRYPDEWVLLIEFDEREDKDDADWDSAIVAAHAPRRAEAYANAREIVERHKHVGFFFTGRVRSPISVFLEP
jgi:hypothetical protein